MKNKGLHDIYYRFPSDFPLPFILDGATGTALMKSGMPKGVSTEEWVLEHPDSIKKIQREYIRAGSDAIYSPTFGANRAVLSRHDIKKDVSEINRSLLSLSKAAVKAQGENSGSRCRIGGDMSPTGCMLEPFGDTTFDEVADIYAEQAAALADAGADFICIETGISLQEARAAVIGTKSVTALPVFVTLTFDETGRTMSGDTLAAAIVTLANLGVCAVGANCSSGPEDMLTLLAQAAKYGAAYGIPLIAKPNAGMPHTDDEGNTSFDLSPDEFAPYTKKFLEAGIFVLGGCCGTDHRYISLIRKTADQFALTEAPDYLREAQNISPEFLAANNRIVCDIRHAKKNKSPIATDDSFFDAVTTAQENGIEILHINVTPSGAEILLENEFFLSVPIMLSGDEKEIAIICRRYNGHPIVL